MKTKDELALYIAKELKDSAYQTAVISMLGCICDCLYEGRAKLRIPRDVQKGFESVIDAYDEQMSRLGKELS